MAAEMVGSAVVGEVVNRTSSFLISKHRERRLGNISESLERLEMAHIRMEAALEVSARRWQVTDVAMLRWRRKLRRAADECGAATRRWKLRVLEEERLARSWLPRRAARRVASVVSSLLVSRRRNEESDAKVVRRFETLADGAGDFLRYLQSSDSGSALHRRRKRRCTTLLDDAATVSSRKPAAIRGVVQGGPQRCVACVLQDPGRVRTGVEIKPVVLM